MASESSSAQHTPTRLHIPKPHLHVGEKPDYSWLNIPPAGILPRPPIDAEPRATAEHARGMIRVLDDAGTAVGAWNPELDPEFLRLGLRTMMLTRAYDERMNRAQRQGKTSFYMKCTGEEAVGVAQAMALNNDDMAFTTYRQQGLLLARDWSMLDMMCQIFNNTRDRLHGRQLPVLYSAKDAGYFTLSGNVATQVINAVGWAMASAYKCDARIAATWIGEGSTAEADFHYGLTFAAVYRAPIVITVVNNQWAISTPQAIAGGEEATFAERGLGHGLPSMRVDGNDFLAVWSATKWAADRARAGHGATLIELFTYRAAAHSTSDDPSRYRPADDWDSWPLGDPIERLARHLILRQEWTEDRHAALREELDEQVRTTAREAESFGTLDRGKMHDVSTMFEDVYKEMPWHLREQMNEVLADRGED